MTWVGYATSGWFKSCTEISETRSECGLCCWWHIWRLMIGPGVNSCSLSCPLVDWIKLDKSLTSHNLNPGSSLFLWICTEQFRHHHCSSTLVPSPLQLFPFHFLITVLFTYSTISKGSTDVTYAGNIWRIRKENPQKRTTSWCWSVDEISERCKEHVILKWVLRIF